MSSDNYVIDIENISKCYNVYSNPRDRLKQFLYPNMQKILSKEQKKYYHEFWALKDINLKIKKGETAGIVGRNGSGKSTLLQIITGTLTPTTGTAKTTGRIAALLELGSGFNPDFTGRENIYLNGSILGLSRDDIDNKFDAIASFADIGRYLNQPVKTYSSGMLVRLAFAVQVQLEPDILIVDEALAVGDALFQKRCFQKIEQLTNNGLTLLFVSHDQESVRTLTNKAILLDKGIQLATGTSSEVLLEYRNLLHNEELQFLSESAKKIEHQAEDNKKNLSVSKQVHHDKNNKIDRLSFGSRQAEVLNVDIFDDSGKRCNAFIPGDKIHIRINCITHEDIDKINVSLRIRNKEGIKIYSWGTLNQDMTIRFKKSNKAQFWERKFKKNEKFSVDMSFECCLGTNLYEIQAALSYEETPNYFSQKILHWQDEAAFFNVQVLRDEYFFGGAVDLKMLAKW